jgi:hypothetical protein
MLYDIHHLKKTKGGYFRHLKYAMYFNVIALLVFITGTIHAFVPFLFPYLPYDLAKRITDGTEKHFK